MFLNDVSIIKITKYKFKEFVSNNLEVLGQTSTIGLRNPRQEYRAPSKLVLTKILLFSIVLNDEDAEI